MMKKSIPVALVLTIQQADCVKVNTQADMQELSNMIQQSLVNSGADAEIVSSAESTEHINSQI